MLPRILRVTRAKNMKNRKSAANRTGTPFLRNAESTQHRPTAPPQVRPPTGRARKLFGLAGAAKLRAAKARHRPMFRSSSGVDQSPESIVFEGFRASSGQAKGALQTARRKPGKPSNRSKEFKMKGKRKTKQ